MTDTQTPPAEDSSAGTAAGDALERELTGNPSANAKREARKADRLKVAQGILGVSQTGKMGAPTKDALRAYQRAASLPVTGDLDSETWTALHR